MNVNETKAVVTGGASGLGAAAARELSARGARVALFDLDAEQGERLAGETGGRFFKTDVTSERETADALRAAADAMGGLTACVNCAGIGDSALTLSRRGPHPHDLFTKVIDVNLTGTFTVARHSAAIMAENPPSADGERGVIVNTASIAAFDGQRGQAAYAASKAGIAGMTLPMARDLGPQGIRVNCIAPGVFETPMAAGLSDKVRAGLVKNVVFPRRLGLPAEFAKLAVFLVECAYMNGETVRIDGALRM